MRNIDGCCCSRMLGIVYQSKRSYIGLKYYGHTSRLRLFQLEYMWFNFNQCWTFEVEKWEGGHFGKVAGGELQEHF